MEVKKYREVTTTKSGKPCIRCEITTDGFAVGNRVIFQEFVVGEDGRGQWHVRKAVVESFGKPYDYILESGYIADHTDYQNDDFVKTGQRKIRCQNVYAWTVIADELRD